MTRSLAAAAAGDLTPFEGAQAQGTIPIREAVINEAMQEAVRSHRGRIKDVDIRILPDNTIDCGVQIGMGPFAKWFRPRFVLSAHTIANHGPVFVLTVASSEYLGLMWIAQVFAAEYFPKGLQLDGRQIVVDLAAMPQARPAQPILRFLRGLDVRTSEGIALIDFAVKVQH